MYCLSRIATSLHNKPFDQTRNIWGWLNIIFNSVDDDRRKLVGADRTCAEWILRNGGSVKFTAATEYLSDYNQLPPENVKLRIQEVDATESSISHYGFPNFAGCKHINKIILHKCSYLENEALSQLKPLNSTLNYLQVTSCGNITEEGLNSLAELSNLQTLIIGDLPYLKHKEVVLKNLVQALTKCNVKLE